jgi:hypothetical protein
MSKHETILKSYRQTTKLCKLATFKIKIEWEISQNG